MSKRTMTFRGGAFVYLLDGKEVSEKKWHADWHVKPPNYEKGEFPVTRGDKNDFSTENGGKGRYNPQMAKHPHDQNAYFTSVNAVKEEAKKRGLSYETS